VEIISLLVSFALGAVSSWAISHYYYRRTERDSVDALFAHRIDSCNEGDKTFLVAMKDANKPIPLYSSIHIEFETQGGRKGSWYGDSSTMSRSVNLRAKACTQHHSDSRMDEDRKTISLTQRGHENAEYLLRKEYKWAHFLSIEDSERIRLDLFQYEHKRKPKKVG